MRTVKVRTPSGIHTIVSHRGNEVHRVIHEAPFSTSVSAYYRGRDVDELLAERFPGREIISDVTTGQNRPPAWNGTWTESSPRSED